MGVTRDSLVQCLEQLVDADHDGNVTAVEIDAFFANQTALGTGSCLPWNMTTYTAQINGTIIVQQCDTNQDGGLTAAADTSCLQTPMARDYLCRLCVRCGWTPPVIARNAAASRQRHVFPPHPFPMKRMPEKKH